MTTTVFAMIEYDHKMTTEQIEELFMMIKGGLGTMPVSGFHFDHIYSGEEENED